MEVAREDIEEVNVSKKSRRDEWIEQDGLTRIEGWAREGLSNGQIAQEMGICPDTLRNWMKERHEIGEALNRGRAPVDVEVENALLKAALGYTVKVRKPFKLKEVHVTNGEGRTESERIEYAEEEVHVPGRITAITYWLKNQRPERWKDRPESDNDGDEPLDEVLRRWDEE